MTDGIGYFLNQGFMTQNKFFYIMKTILDLIFFECNIYEILLIGAETNLEHSKTIHSSKTLYLVISSFCIIFSNFVILHNIILFIVLVLLHFDDVGMLLPKHVLIMLLIIIMIIKTFTLYSLHLPIFLKRKQARDIILGYVLFVSYKQSL